MWRGHKTRQLVKNTRGIAEMIDDEEKQMVETETGEVTRQQAAAAVQAVWRGCSECLQTLSSESDL